MRIVPKTTRIRAVVRKPAELRLIGGRVFFFADGPIEQGRISGRPLAKRPLVDADVADAGGARLLTAMVCQ